MSDSKPKIMIVEDENPLLEIIVNKVDARGARPFACNSVEQAIGHLEDNDDDLPDLIWLDYYLKDGQNGLDFVRQLKENREWKSIPVVIVSNTASYDKVQEMLDLGAMKYMVKAEHRLDSIVDSVHEIAVA